MLYMFKVYTLVAVFVFGFAAIVMMTLAAWNEAKKYALARQAGRRLPSAATSEPLAIS